MTETEVTAAELNTMLFATNDQRYRSTEFVFIEMETAYRFLVENEYPHQRPMRNGHVTFLEGEIKKGKFNQYTTIVFARVNGHDYQMDGRHRLQAIVNTEIGQWFNTIVLEMTEEEAAWYYGNMDSGLRRLPTDTWRAFELPEKLQLSHTHMNSYGSAIKYMMSGMYGQSRNDIHKDDQLRGIHLYAPWASIYFDIARPARFRNASWRRQSVIGPALLSLRYSQPKIEGRTAQAFWEAVMTGDGLIAGDPRKLTYEFLMTSRVISGRASGLVVTEAFGVRYIAHMFNAWMNGKEVKNNPYKVIKDVEYEPVYIFGVPGATEWFK